MAMQTTSVAFSIFVTMLLSTALVAYADGKPKVNFIAEACKNISTDQRANFTAEVCVSFFPLDKYKDSIKDYLGLARASNGIVQALVGKTKAKIDDMVANPGGDGPRTRSRLQFCQMDYSDMAATMERCSEMILKWPQGSVVWGAPQMSGYLGRASKDGYDCISQLDDVNEKILLNAEIFEQLQLLDVEGRALANCVPGWPRSL